MKIENKKNRVVVKVPAKLIISGEHSVIYNKKAVVCSVGIFLKIKIKKCGFFELKKNKIIVNDNKKLFYFDVEDFFTSKNNKGNVYEVLKKFFLETNVKPSCFKVIINNNIPQNYGLGSSASFIVGLLFGLNEFFKTNINVDRMLKFATETENIFHTKSSGIDIKTVLFGGVLFFNKDGVIKLPNAIKRVFLVSTGRAVFSTKDVVEYVRHCGVSNKTWEDFDKITTQTADLIKDYKDFSGTTKINQSLLENIGVVSPVVKNFITNLSRYKIYGKICGAGTIGDTGNYKNKNINDLQNNGIVGVFHTLTVEQFGFLKRECKKNNFKLKTVNIVDSGLFLRVAQ